MKNPFLIGTKVYLRPLERSDGPLFVEWLNNPQIQRTTLRDRPLNVQDEEEFIDRVRKNPNDVALLIVTQDTDTPVGGTALHLNIASFPPRLVGYIAKALCVGLVVLLALFCRTRSARRDDPRLLG